MTKEQIRNIAFVDGQNLYMGTARMGSDSWMIDLARFRTYLTEKYNVDRAYYFLGCLKETNQDVYESI